MPQNQCQHSRCLKALIGHGIAEMPFNKRKRLPIAPTTEGRICWLCEHIRFSNGSPGYSEQTPGSDFWLECGKGYWEFDNHDDGLDEFRQQLEAAETCGDFSERKR